MRLLSYVIWQWLVLALISGGATSVLELSTEGVINGFPCSELGGNVGIEDDNIAAFGEASRVLASDTIAEVIFLADVGVLIVSLHRIVSHS